KTRGRPALATRAHLHPEARSLHGDVTGWSMHDISSASFDPVKYFAGILCNVVAFPGNMRSSFEDSGRASAEKHFAPFILRCDISLRLLAWLVTKDDQRCGGRNEANADGNSWGRKPSGRAT